MKLTDINIRDPFILTENGQYYLYGTRGASCWGTATGIDVYTSQDLETWSEPHEVFSAPSDREWKSHMWAPEVHKYNDAFYMFVTFNDPENATYILRADDPKGPFVMHSEGAVTPKNWVCLDGTFYMENGRPYIVFCHEWVQAGDGEILAMRLTEDLKAAAEPPFLLFRASEAPWSRPVRHSSGITGHVTDGPFLWRREDGALLCLWSGFSEKGYAQGLAVSDNGEIDGHFTQTDPLFLEDGGHGMLFRDLGGKVLLTLHSPNTHLLERPRFVPVSL